MKCHIPIIILLSSIISECTLNDPEYKLDFDRVETAPTELYVKPINLFDVEITWAVATHEDVDSYSIFRSVQETELAQPEAALFQEISSTIMVIDELNFTVIDSSAELNKWNYYYVIANHDDQSSLHSDVVGCLFTINSPSVSLVVGGENDAHIIQSYMLNNNELDGIEISRIGENDTMQYEYGRDNDDSLITVVDTMQFDQDSILPGFKGRQLHAWADVEPNIPYDYRARAYTDRDTTRRYTSLSLSNIISIQREYPKAIASLPLSSNRSRLYFHSFDLSPYDSILIFSAQDDYMNIMSSLHVDEGVGFIDNAGEELTIFDLECSSSDVIPIKAIFWGESSHTALMKDDDIQDSTGINCLAIPGFQMIEEGVMFPGCGAGQSNHDCEGEGYEIERFYLAIHETTNMSPSTWPPSPGEFPVEYVTWDSAVGFCEMLNIQFPGYEFKLPSEAQWEFSAKHSLRDNRNYSYPWGVSVDIYHANYANSNPGTIAVGSYSYPGFSGQYDLSGNVMEWVYSNYNEIFDPSLPNVLEDNWKVIRGGSFWQNPDEIMTTSRGYLPRGTESEGLGFRVMMRPKL
jgi:hypothetical protein